jgi:S-layer homology domain
MRRTLLIITLFFISLPLAAQWEPEDPAGIVTGTQVLFRGTGGAYLMVTKDAVQAAAHAPRDAATIVVEDLDGGALLPGDTVRLRTSDGRYLQADKGTLSIASGDAAASSQHFRIVSDGKETIAHGAAVGLMADDGRYLHVAADGTVSAAGATMGAEETLTFVEGNTPYEFLAPEHPAGIEFGLNIGATIDNQAPYPTSNSLPLGVYSNELMHEFRTGLGAKWIRLEADWGGSDVVGNPRLRDHHRALIRRAHNQGRKVVVVLFRLWCGGSEQDFINAYRDRLNAIQSQTFVANDEKPDAYEIGNEANRWVGACSHPTLDGPALDQPDVMGWRLPGDTFARLLRSAWNWKWSLNVPPGALRPQIVSGGTLNAYQDDPAESPWWNALFSTLAQQPDRPFDAFGVHPYNYRELDRNCLSRTDWPVCFETAPAYWKTSLKNRLRDLRGRVNQATHTSDTRLFPTEYGFANHAGYCPPNEFCGVLTPEQAAYGIDQYHNVFHELNNENPTNPYIDRATQYAYRDSGGEAMGVRVEGPNYPIKAFVWYRFSQIAGGNGNPTLFWRPTGDQYVMQAFPDVAPGSTFYPFIQTLAHNGVVESYPDEPNSNFLWGVPNTRGVSINWIVRARQWPLSNPSNPTFHDVGAGHPYYQYIETAAARGMISGYNCGQAKPCFYPANTVTRGQTAKIVSIAWGWNEPVSTQTFEDVPPGSTFYVWIERIANRGIVSGYSCGGPGEPCVPPQNRPYFRPYNDVTRGQTAKIVANSH